VDERIVGHKPKNIDFAQAAALPLTTITAWELLFDRLEVSRDAGATQGKSLLVIGAAGGVGSILVQLARQLTGLTIIGTASRPETGEWIAAGRAPRDRPQQAAAARNRPPRPAAGDLRGRTEPDRPHWNAISELVAPQGKVALIDDPASIDVRTLKRKSVSLHWEFMYTRSMFQTDDIQKQHQLLNDVAKLVETGAVKTTLAERFGKINAANLKRAHALIESNTRQGQDRAGRLLSASPRRRSGGGIRLGAQSRPAPARHAGQRFLHAAGRAGRIQHHQRGLPALQPAES
jgi:zinc-binding alcohol dehydrogenase family protein